MRTAPPESPVGYEKCGLSFLLEEFTSEQFDQAFGPNHVIQLSWEEMEPEMRHTVQQIDPERSHLWRGHRFFANLPEGFVWVREPKNMFDDDCLTYSATRTRFCVDLSARSKACPHKFAELVSHGRGEWAGGGTLYCLSYACPVGGERFTLYRPEVTQPLLFPCIV